MTMRAIFSPHHKRNVIVGGRRKPAPGARAKHHAELKHILLAALPAPPTTFTFWNSTCDSVERQIFLNDQLGDCVEAAIGGHQLGIATGNAGSLVSPTDADIEAQYSAIGGYVPGNPSTDQGSDEVTAANYYCSTGWSDGTVGLGQISVDASSKPEMAAAIYNFEGAIACACLPDAWISPFPSGDGFVWDVAGAPDDNNGHCFFITGINAQGYEINTWGIKGTLTFAAAAMYLVESAGGSVNVILTPDILNRAQQTAGNGIAWAQLVAEFNADGGNVTPPPAPAPSPNPSPTPTPTPPAPAPSSGPTLAQVEAALTAAFHSHHSPVMVTRKALELAIAAVVGAWSPTTTP